MIATWGAAAPVPGLPANSLWSQFKALRTGGEGELYMLTATSSGGGLDTAVKVLVDANGNIQSMELLGLEGDVLAGTGEELASFPGGPNTFGFEANEVGDVVARVDYFDPVTLQTTRRVMKNFTQIVAQPGMPMGGAQIMSIRSGLGINDHGDVAFGCALNTAINTDEAIVFNGAIFVQEGDVLPSLAPASLGNFGGTSPISVTNSGDVFWIANLNGAAAGTERAYMRNDEVIVRLGDTVSGATVTGLRLGQDAFRTSRDGRFWAGEVTLQGVGATLVVADFGLIVPFPDQGINLGTLEHVAGEPVVGNSLTLRMDNGTSAGEATLLLFSPDGREPGIVTGVGELLIGVSNFLVVGPFWNGSAVDLNFPVPNDQALIGAERVVQGFFINPMTLLSTRYTNAFRIQLGAP